MTEKLSDRLNTVYLILNKIFDSVRNNISSISEMLNSLLKNKVCNLLFIREPLKPDDIHKLCYYM